MAAKYLVLIFWERVSKKLSVLGSPLVYLRALFSRPTGAMPSLLLIQVPFLSCPVHSTLGPVSSPICSLLSNEAHLHPDSYSPLLASLPACTNRCPAQASRSSASLGTLMSHPQARAFFFFYCLCISDWHTGSPARRRYPLSFSSFAPVKLSAMNLEPHSLSTILYSESFLCLCFPRPSAMLPPFSYTSCGKTIFVF